MTQRIIRVLSALLGLALVLMAVPIGKLDGFSLPTWIQVATIFVWGAILIHYAVVGYSTQNSLVDGGARKVIVLVLTYYPLLFLTVFYLSIVYARVIVGHWPAPYSNDPSFSWFRNEIVPIVGVFMAAWLLEPIVSVVAIYLMARRLIPIVVALSIWAIPFVFAVLDPWGYINWWYD